MSGKSVNVTRYRSSQINMSRQNRRIIQNVINLMRRIFGNIENLLFAEIR